MNSDYFCPICLETGTDRTEHIEFSCGHGIHRECSWGLTSFRCPICSQNVKDSYPDDIIQAIEINAEEYKTDVERYEMELALESTDDLIGQNGIMRLVEQAATRVCSPVLETLLFTRYMATSGIPKRYIPQRVDITIPSGDFKLERGFIFTQLLRDSMNRLMDDIESSYELYPDEIGLTEEEFLEELDNLPSDDESDEIYSVPVVRIIRQ